MTRLLPLAGAAVVVAALVVSEVTMRPTGAERIVLYGLFTGTAAVAALAGWGLTAVHRRFRSLRWTLVGVGLAAVGAVAAVVGASAAAMFLSPHDLVLVGAALVFGVGLGSVLAVGVADPLTADLRRLAGAARAVAAGDLTVRSHIARADELGALSSSLDAMVARLAGLQEQRERGEKARRELLAAIGHDLRTPLAALQAAIEALQDGVGGDPDRYLRSMAADVGLLRGMVDDLFVLARLEAGELRLERMPVDLVELADGAVESMASMAARRDVRLQLVAAHPVVVEGDPQALGRVLRNLLDNAIGHAPARTTVRVRVGPDDEAATVRVEDDGPGFPAGFAGRAFEPFSRPDDARNRSAGGAGLGLAIARGLVLAHGGRIWIEQGAGGRVVFGVPSPSADGAPGDESMGRPGPNGPAEHRHSAPDGVGDVRHSALDGDERDV